MKKTILALALLLCASAHAETVAERWNACFSLLNPIVPVNKKWSPDQQQNYLKGLIRAQEAKGVEYYKSPDKYRCEPAVIVPPVVIPTSPVVQPTNHDTLISAARNLTEAVQALEREIQLLK